jgi:hypothetical protein
MKYTPEQIIDRQEKLKADRGVWEQHWQELADYNLPRKNQFTRVNVSGEKKGFALYDNTSMVSCDQLSSALHGMLTNPNTLWFSLAADREDLLLIEDVVEYLQDLTKRMHRVLNNSNFQSEIHEFYLDLCGFGTATMTVERDSKKIVRFSTKHLGEIFICENAFGMIEEVYRLFKWEAAKIIQEFCVGIDEKDKAAIENKVGRKVAEAFYKGDKTEFEIVHCVYREQLLINEKMPFESRYVLKAEKKLVKEGKFRRFPYLVSRWTKISGEVYGRSPAMNALPEAKTLNMMAKTMLQGAQKVVDPPVQMPDDGFVRPLKTFPGGVNYYRAGSSDRVEPVFADTRLDWGFEAMKERQLRVQQAFYIDRLNLAQSDRMTTVEVNQRIQEQLRFLGPMLGRQQTEFLQPLVDRVLDIMIEEDAGTGEIIGNPPEAIQAVELDVAYSSPIARAQRMQEAESLQAALAASAPVMQIDPTVIDVLDTEAIVRQNFQIYGASQKVLRRRQEVEQIRDARQAAQEQAVQMQQQMHGAEVASKVGPLLKA